MRILIFFSLLVLSSIAHAQTQTDKPPVDFDAERLFYDDQTETVIAMGEVQLEQEGRTLTANQVIYDLKQDLVVARGNVVLTEKDGTKYFADELQLSDQMRKGYVMMLQGTLPNGSRFAAEKGERRQEEGDQIIMKDARYTACKPCEKDPDKAPIWQLKASEVTHHRDEQRISYDNATFEIAGVPVAWTPYFSHPDGTVAQKSGLIDPVAGFDSELGAFAGAAYYYAIDEDKDATIGLTAYSDSAPLLTGEYRQRFDTAQLEAAGSITYSDRTDQVAGFEDNTEDEVRGHAEIEGLWNINQHWRAGVDLNVTTDEQYLRQYDISDEDVLENELYVERFSGRNYMAGRLLAFQDIRVLEERADQPSVLPEIEVSYKGDPNGLMGGRWAVDLSALALQREGSGQDVGRFSTQFGWQTHNTTNFGLLTTVDLSARGDVYHSSDLNRATDNSGLSRDDTETRFFPQAHIESSYPFARGFENSPWQAVIEPVVAITAAPNITDQDDIPNEDSQDAQVEPFNLFSPNRFPGYDRVEDRSRVSYGLRNGLYADDGSELTTFIGQSYNFDDKDNPFPEGSGLATQTSNIVAEVGGKYKENLEFNYRTQLDNSNFASQRHEVDAIFQTNRFQLRSQYFFTKPLEGTDLDESREQYRGNGRLRLSRDWYASAGTVYDLGEDPGLREADLGLEYVGDCVSIGTFFQRDLTNDSSGDSDTELFIRIGFKTLGNFQTSGITLSDGSSEDE